MSLLHVYGVVRTPAMVPGGERGVEGAAVYAVAAGGVAALASDVGAPPEPTRGNLLAHERVIDRALAAGAVLPLPFGTRVPARAELEALLDASGRAFGELLQRLEGQVEFGLRVRWDRERAALRVRAEDEELRRLQRSIDALAAGSTYFARRELAYRTDEALATLATRHAQEVADTLRPLVTTSQSHPAPDEQLVLDSAFLVARERADAFVAQLHQLGARHAGLLSFQVAGPRAPVSFVNVRL